MPMIARDHPRDSRLNENAYGAADPTSDRKLSPSVKSACSPCTQPMTNITTNASPGLNTSAAGPNRTTAIAASPSPTPFTIPMIG